MPRESRQNRKFDCACVQFDVARGDVARNRELALRGVRDAAAAGARLVVLPEMWTTSFVTEPSDELLQASREAEDAMSRLSGELALLVVGGGIERRGRHLFNRATVVDSGRLLGVYRKIHLFTPNAEHRHMSPGEEPLIVDTRLGRLGVLICYDIRFPELVRHYFMHDVELLAVPAQWPEARALHWRTLLQARAVENEMFVVGCNRTGHEPSVKNPSETLVFPGDSRVVDPMGEILAAGAGDAGPVVAEVDPRKVKTMRRILPIARDRRPELYASLWNGRWT